jgi:hypothetical protein
MTAAQVHSLFKDYADAFSDRAIDRIAGLWSYPAFLSFEGRQVAFDRETFHDNLVRLCGFYAAQGVARAHKEVLEFHHLTATTASVRTADTLYDADGRLVAEWEHAYVLSETAEGIKVAAAMPDDELRAWRDRGTPLGGKDSNRSANG